MHNYRLFVASGLNFADSTDALRHIGEKMVNKGVVKDSYPAALLERERHFPTGIALQGHAVAIPHCEATHAMMPAIYLLRPVAPVLFSKADDEGQIAVELIMALIVTHPQEQLRLLRSLFAKLQENEFITGLLNAKDSATARYFYQHLLAPGA